MEPKSECIDSNYIATILSGDWGFWYDGTNNLNHVSELGQQFVKESKISTDQWGIISNRLGQLNKIIAAREKTPRWKIRERVGIEKQWYRDVTELCYPLSPIFDRHPVSFLT